MGILVLRIVGLLFRDGARYAAEMPDTLVGVPEVNTATRVRERPGA
jgi:hypothetical protein